MVVTQGGPAVVASVTDRDISQSCSSIAKNGFKALVYYQQY